MSTFVRDLGLFLLFGLSMFVVGYCIGSIYG